MAHFAELINGIVARVIVVSNADTASNGVEDGAIGTAFCHNLLGGEWLQTSYNGNMRKNYASSGKIFKINSLYIANIDGTTAADLTVNHYSQAALGGTAIAIASTVAVAADSTLVVITKDSAFYLLENQSLGCLCATSGDLQFVASWDEIS